MYLTRFQINPARRGARKLLSSPHVMHAAVLAGFPDPAVTGTTTAGPTAIGPGGGRILWRLDQHTPPQVSLYIASPTEPDLTHLVEQAGWPTTNTWHTRPYTPFLTSLRPGQQWAFRLTANPVRYGNPPKNAPNPTQRQRFGHVTATQQQQWLLDRAERAGFRLTTNTSGETELTVHNRATHTFRRGTGTVTLRTATFDGRLEVTDADVLRTVLTGGLGHAKAYGCGLLTLAPAD
jgi:CRISPR system Cascade subunit CasE